MPKRILAADDSRTIRLAIAYTFQKEPAVELLLASSGNDALDILRREPVDLLLLDYQMPDIDGTALCARLKQEPQLAHIPILLLTGRNYDPSQTRKLGANGAIPKPFLTSELIKRAAGILSFRYTPSPLSIAEEMGERRADSIEIDIDLGLDDVSAPTGQVPAPAASSTPRPSTRPGPPPPGPARTVTGSHTPLLMPEKELPFHGDPFAPPPASMLASTGVVSSQNMIIDDLPFDHGSHGVSPTHTPGAALGPPPGPLHPAGRNPTGGHQPPLPPPLPGMPGRSPSQIALPAASQTHLPKATPLGKGVDEELEVFVGKPIESFSPVRSDPEELVLPMEDELIDDADFAAPKGPLRSASPTPGNLTFPPLTTPARPPLPPTPTPPSFEAPRPTQQSTAEAELFRQGAYLQSNKMSDVQERRSSPAPAPTPLPPFAPKEPPKRPKGRVSPQATQKFRMLDLLDENDLSTTSRRGPHSPAIVAVDSLLPTAEVATISQITEDILDIEISEGETFSPAPPTSQASTVPEVTAPSAPPAFAPARSTPAVLPPFPTLQPPPMPPRSDAAPSPSPSSSPFEKMTSPAPALTQSESPTKAEPAPAPLAPSTATEDAPALKKDKHPSKDISYEMPYVAQKEEKEAEGTAIRVKATAFVKGPGGHPTTESSASFPMIVEAPLAPCPPGQVQLCLGAALSLREFTWLLQFANHLGQLIETRFGEAPTAALFINSQRHADTTTLSCGGEQPHLIVLLLLFIECWPNLQDEDKESIARALFERIEEEQQPTIQRMVARLVVDVQPYIQALRQALPLLQNTALELVVSGLSTPAATLYEDDGISSMVIEEPLRKERNALVQALRDVLDIRALRDLLREAFSLDLEEIVPSGLPSDSMFLAVMYHFELRHQIPDLAEAIQEQISSFDPTAFIAYPGN